MCCDETKKVSEWLRVMRLILLIIFFLLVSYVEFYYLTNYTVNT